MDKPANSILVIFGASGDLTKRKLIPSLFELYKQELMCDSFAVLGVSRTHYSDDEYRKKMFNDVKKYSDDKNIDDGLLQKFLKNIYYLAIDTEDPDEYSHLKDKLEELDKIKQTKGNFIYYLSTPPKLYLTIAQALGRFGLQNHSDDNVKKKIIIEKPFGYDLDSAIELNEKLHEIFKENQIYRIDHYLGKETVQNILVLRFANGIFEPMWNRNFIDHVEITSSESIGVEGRGGYYEGSGALRDMIQNHMLQLVGFIAMEPPSSFDANPVRNETLKVFESLRQINEEEVEKFVVRGQYTESTVRGEKIPGYRDEENVAQDSRTETYAAMKFYIDNWRWAGVPFYVRAGKRLPTRVTEVVIYFKETPYHLFNKDGNEQFGNQLIIRIQPDEGILLKFGMKVPGAGFKINTVNMDFHYADIIHTFLPSAYERLLLDCMLGDSTLYARGDAVEACWRFVDPILKAWKNNPAIKIYGYPAGTWGPMESFHLFENNKQEWRYPCKNLTDDGLYCEL
ncbi:MAG: glucose-6-phosphate dehydrogenase [Ignavibacteriaceae bacterium]